MAEATAQAQRASRPKPVEPRLPSQQRRMGEFGRMMVLDMGQPESDRLKAKADGATEDAKKPVGVNPGMTREEREERWFAVRFAPM